MKTLVFLITILTATLGFLSSIHADQFGTWDNCANANGNLIFKDRKILADLGTQETKYRINKILKKVNLKTIYEMCDLRSGEKLHVQRKTELSYETIEIKMDDYVFTEEFICSKGIYFDSKNDQCIANTMQVVEQYLVEESEENSDTDLDSETETQNPIPRQQRG